MTPGDEVAGQTLTVGIANVVELRALKGIRDVPVGLYRRLQ